MYFYRNLHEHLDRLDRNEYLWYLCYMDFYLYDNIDYASG